MYLPHKIYKTCFDVPGGPVISGYGTPKTRVSEFLGSHFKEIMQENWSYVNDSNYFINKTKNL